jgi:hypothetical protein
MHLDNHHQQYRQHTMSNSPLTEQPKRRWLRWLIGGIAVFLLGAIALVVGGMWWVSQQDFLGTTKVDELTPAQITDVAAITLPKSARNLHSHYAAFQDYIVHVRFEIDPSETQSFVDSLSLNDPTRSTSQLPNLYSEGMPAWWQPEKATQFQAIEGAVRTSATYPDWQIILIDTSAPTNHIVYVVAYDT